MSAAAPHYPFTPYCGRPPSPDELAAHWNLDPILIAALALSLAAYLLLARERHEPAWRRVFFVAGWAITGVALVSPLCALSVALFSARVGQHMILTFIAAPLFALGRPGRVFALPKLRVTGGELTAAVIFAVLLWVWHTPGPYAATFDGGHTYWQMHLSLIGSAVWLWSALFRAPAERPGSFVAATVLTTLQMAFLGALITFSPDPLYAPHLTTTQAFGLTPIQDQELGGVIMWVPAGLVMVAAVLSAMLLLLRRAGERAAAYVSA